MREIKKYIDRRPGIYPVLDEQLLRECQRRALPSNYAAQNLISGCLTPARHEALFYLTQGLTQKQIADLMVTQPSSTKTHLKYAFRVLDARSKTEASLKVVAIGAVSMEDIIDPEERQAVWSLADEHKAVLDLMIENYGRESSSQAIADNLKRSQLDINSRLDQMMKATDIHSSTRLALAHFSLVVKGL